MVEINDFLVSVIIPTYNRADVVARAILSVQEQSYQNLEIIIVDDASQDHTAGVVQQINDHRLRYICHPTNLGGSEARNTGINEAQGKYVAFLDSDDVWLPHKLQSQLNVVSQLKSQDNLVCYSQFQKSWQVFYQKSILPAKGKHQQQSIPEYFWLSGGEMLTSTLLISRSIARATLFKTGLVKHQDLDFIIRLEKQGAKFVFVPQVLTIWHNEPRRDRISRQVNYQASLDWIEQYRDRISERSFQGFLLKEIVPKMIKEPGGKFKTASLVVQALRNQVISPFYGFYLLVKSLLPTTCLQSIKKIIQQK